MPLNPFLDFVALYRPDPVRFVREVLGMEPDPIQAEIMQAVARGDRYIAVRSGHGVGKTTTASWIVIWYILTRIPFKVVLTSQSAPQLFDALYVELKMWIGKLPAPLQSLLIVLSDRIELAQAPSEGFVTAKTSRADSPEAMAGVHSANVLLIGDEASGIPEQVFEAAGGSMAGDNRQMLLMGNPLRSSGYFYDAFHKMAARWTTFKISRLESPRPGGAQYAEEQAEKYGLDSNVYRVRVLGEFPLADNDTVIPVELVELAMVRDVKPINAKPIWGVDVAYQGDDASALAKRCGNILTEKIRKWYKTDTMQTTGIIKLEWDATPTEHRPVEILVDSIGYGAGVANRLAEMGLPARGINVSENPAIKNQYINLRTELWFKAREWFMARDCSIPRDDELLADLVSVKYLPPVSQGKIPLETKDQTKKRIKRSPDIGDAFVLTFASDAGIALYGTSYISDWRKPLHRGLSMV